MLIAAFYGSISMFNVPGKTLQEVTVTASTEKSLQPSSSMLLVSKHDNLTTSSSGVLQANILVSPRAERSFFTHSATIQHYISTI